jgi:hypothetical protein
MPGLALFGEFIRCLGLSRWLATEMPKPGSARGYAANAFVTPLVLMLTGGGRSLEDPAYAQERHGAESGAQAGRLAQHRRDGRLVAPNRYPHGGWTGWVGSTGERWRRAFDRSASRRTRWTGDASQIVAEKEAAHVTYKGEQGDMPMIGHLAEAGVVIHDEFPGRQHRPGDTEPRIHPSVRSALAQGTPHCPRLPRLRRLPG